MTTRLEEQIGAIPAAKLDPRGVLELARSLAAVVHQETLLSTLTESLRKLAGADLVLVLQRDSQSEDFTPIHSLAVDDQLLRQVGFAGRGGLAGWLLKHGKCIDLYEQLHVEQYLDAWELELLQKLKIHLCMPLRSLGKLIGMILLGSAKRDWRLNHEDLDLLDILGLHAALALENAQLHSQQHARLFRFYRAERLAVAAGVAHEIRNPLTAISSTIQYILRDLSMGDPKRGLIQELLNEVDRIHQTIESLLRLTRVEEPRREKYDLLEILDQVLLLIEGRARQAGIEVDKVYAGERLFVMADRDQLKQVFLNLLLNAIQAMDGGGRLEVRAAPWLSRFRGVDHRAQVEISDTGCGIGEEQIERIFDPFFTTKREGTGLGLTICQTLLELHHGEIEVQSTVGQGTTVCVRLPLLA